MPTLTITVEVANVDPRDTDPFDLANDLLDHAVEQGRKYAGGPIVDVVVAEWVD